MKKVVTEGNLIEREVNIINAFCLSVVPRILVEDAERSHELQSWILNNLKPEFDYATAISIMDAATAIARSQIENGYEKQELDEAYLEKLFNHVQGKLPTLSHEFPNGVWTFELEGRRCYATPFWEGEEGISFELISDDGDSLYTELLPFELTYVPEYDSLAYLDAIQKVVFKEKTTRLWEKSREPSLAQMLEELV